MNRFLAMLLVLTILLTGCVSDNKKENTTVPEASVSAASSTQAENGDAGYEEAVDDLEEPDLS